MQLLLLEDRQRFPISPELAPRHCSCPAGLGDREMWECWDCWRKPSPSRSTVVCLLLSHVLPALVNELVVREVPLRPELKPAIIPEVKPFSHQGSSLP